jgi:hypothetical protein
VRGALVRGVHDDRANRERRGEPQQLNQREGSAESLRSHAEPARKRPGVTVAPAPKPMSSEAIGTGEVEPPSESRRSTAASPASASNPAFTRTGRSGAEGEAEGHGRHDEPDRRRPEQQAGRARIFPATDAR